MLLDSFASLRTFGKSSPNRNKLSRLSSREHIAEYSGLSAGRIWFFLNCVSWA